MPNQLSLAFTSVAAVIGTGLSFYFWRKSSSLYALLVEGANRFEELRNRTTSLEQIVAKHDEKSRLAREGAARLEKAVSDARDKSAELLKKLETKTAESQIISDKLELQKDFLEKQLIKAQDQLRQSEEQKDVLKAERDRLQTDIAREKDARARAVVAAERGGELKEKELTLRLKDAERSVEVMKKKFAAVDPNEIRKVKRKIVQYERLYASMRGMREMVDERNKNWEVALTKFARWIVLEAAGPDAKVPDQIGPLVGKALDLIGAQLVDDQESVRHGGAGTHSTTFDSGGSGAEAQLAAELAAAEAEMGQGMAEEARLAAATFRRDDRP